MGSSDRQRRVFVAVPTHTTRHLACCLASLQTQTDPPDAVCLSVDNADPDILDLARSTWLGGVSGGAPLLVTLRPSRGVASLNQVRNNALRALESEYAIDGDDLVVVLDGDTALHPSAIGLHRRSSASVVTAYRYDLTEDRTRSLTEHEVRQGLLHDVDAWTTPEQRRTLAERQRRHAKQLAVRSTPVARWFQKRHKPKLLGGHHAASAAALRAINGYDEAYVGYGYDDDDLSRRLNTLRPMVPWDVLTDRALAFHLWHPTRAPSRPTNAPGYALFRQRRPGRAALGWDSPDEQAEPDVEVIRA